MIDALIVFILSLLLLDAAERRLRDYLAALDAAARRLSGSYYDYLAALDGQMEAETTEEQP